MNLWINSKNLEFWNTITLPWAYTSLRQGASFNLASCTWTAGRRWELYGSMAGEDGVQVGARSHGNRRGREELTAPGERRHGRNPSSQGGAPWSAAVCALELGGGRCHGGNRGGASWSGGGARWLEDGDSRRARRQAEGRRMAWRRREREVGCHLWRRSSRERQPRFSIAAIRRTRDECYSSDIGRSFLVSSAWIRKWVT
jgi:hypothetical protein